MYPSNIQNFFCSAGFTDLLTLLLFLQMAWLGAGGYGGAVVIHSLHTSVGGCSNPVPYVGKLVVAY